jgi:hypothetical protein
VVVQYLQRSSRIEDGESGVSADLLYGFGQLGLLAEWHEVSSERLLEQLLMQFLPGFHHQREALGSPLLDPRLHPMRADGVDEQGPSRDSSVRGPEPAQRVEEADPLHADVL